MGKKQKGRDWNGDDENPRKKQQYEASQEELSEYIRTSRPGVLVVVFSLLAVLIAVLVWGFTGTLPVTETVTGLVVEASAYDRIISEYNALYRTDQTEKQTNNQTEDQTNNQAEGQTDNQAEGQTDNQAEGQTETRTDVQANRQSEESADDKADAQATVQTGNDNGEIRIICFVDASRFNGQAVKEFDDKAVLKMPDQNSYTGTIKTRYMVPISAQEAKKILFDNGWAAKKCVKQDYNWMLIIRPDQDLSKYAYTLTEITLTTEEVHPIKFLMK